VGFYGGGRIIRASANSKGLEHWFETENFFIDYSIYQGERAVKGIYSDRVWDGAVYGAKIQQDRSILNLLDQAPRLLDRGSYRVYLAPSGVAALLEMLEGEMGAACLHQHTSALVSLWQGREQFSPLFSLQENFQSGLVPRFNEYGQLAPPVLPLIDRGKLVNILVNSRSAVEYQETPNGANAYETMRGAEISPGELPPDQVLARLDRGIYLSDLHYLNWSDRPKGRVTGMTRFACFWVEDGKLVAPIPAMRFDDSLYSLFGENLEALTTTRELIPDTSTYDHRSVGGRLVPGMIIKELTFTI
jgi:predicted Zn-dependent protease